MMTVYFWAKNANQAQCALVVFIRNIIFTRKTKRYRAILHTQGVPEHKKLKFDLYNFLKTSLLGCILLFLQGTSVIPSRSTAFPQKALHLNVGFLGTRQTLVFHFAH